MVATETKLQRTPSHGVTSAFQLLLARTSVHHGVGADWSVPTSLLIPSSLEMLSRARNLDVNNPKACYPLVKKVLLIRS
jgi:hypothetical protein